MQLVCNKKKKTNESNLDSLSHALIADSKVGKFRLKDEGRICVTSVI